MATKIEDRFIEIAADSQVTYGDFTAVKDHKTVKLFQSDLGLIVGIVGDADGSTLMKMFAKSHVPKAPTEDAIVEFIHEFKVWSEDYADDDVDCSMHLLYQGKAFQTKGYYVKEVTTYAALGTGADYALAVMYLGHTAAEGVVAAIDLNIYCCGPTNVLRMRRS